MKKQKPRTWTPKEPNNVALRELPTRMLQSAMEYLSDEVRMCDEGIVSEDRPAFVALTLVCARELRRRGRKANPNLPKPASAASPTDGKTSRQRIRFT
jgi:hypothetical protein